MKTNKHRTRKIRMTWLALAALALAGIAQAGSNSSQRVSDIVSEQQQIRAEVKAKENGWDNIAAAKRDELIVKQDELMRLIEGKQTLDELAPQDRAAAQQKLEWIAALAGQAKDERRVCTRERSTGSHRIKTVCRSAGDMRRQREQAKDAWQQGRQRLMAPKQSDR